MFFTFLVFSAALTLELFGSYISIMGLAKNASYILVGLAITLDFAKIVIATVLYKQWKNLHAFLKYTLIPPLIFLVLFTSAGAYAFLIQEFSKTTTGQEQAQTRIDSLEQEKIKLEARKKEIDGQIAKLPPESVVQRKRLTELFSKEIQYINVRTIEMDREIPELKVKNLAETTQGGTINSIAKAYGVNAESITKLLVFPLVLVIDPLAIILLTVANFLVEQRKREKKEALNKQLEIEALMAVESKNKLLINPIPPAPIKPLVVSPPIVTPVVEPVTEEHVPLVSKSTTNIQKNSTLDPIIDKTDSSLKNNLWKIPFSDKISNWRNKAIKTEITSGEPTISDIMTELSTLKSPESSTPFNSIEDIAQTPTVNTVEPNTETIAEKTETTITTDEQETNLFDENFFDETPEYEVINESSIGDTVNQDLASIEEVKRALNDGFEDLSFQEISEPNHLVNNETHNEEDTFVNNEEVNKENKDIFETVAVKPLKRKFPIITKSSSEITEKINDDIFNNYEATDSEIMQVIGISEQDKGFDTIQALNSIDEKLF